MTVGLTLGLCHTDVKKVLGQRWDLPSQSFMFGQWCLRSRAAKLAAIGKHHRLIHIEVERGHHIAFPN